MLEFLPDATNFADITKKAPAHDYTVECMKCHGYGYWNLRIDAYGPGKHFQAACGQCNGWGYVRPESPDAKCLHDWGYPVTIGRCLHEYTCKHCKITKVTDSSD